MVATMTTSRPDVSLLNNEAANVTFPVTTVGSLGTDRKITFGDQQQAPITPQTAPPAAAVEPKQTAGDAPVNLDGDKRAVYRHPLFPLLALLFEKCEQATQTTECPSSASFDVDIEAFVRHQEADRKPFFSDDPELDSLMVKAIQVLRIHLLELEKVNELCKDFCNRYITCLKGKMQSENLLRTDLASFPGAQQPQVQPQTQVHTQQDGQMTVQPQVLVTAVTNGSTLNTGMVLQTGMAQGGQTVSLAAVNQGAMVVADGTLYQPVTMVASPAVVAHGVQQSLPATVQLQPVAQAVQQQPQVIATSTAHIISGSTPLSQIGVQAQQGIPQQLACPPTPTATNPVASAQSPQDSPGSEDDLKRRNGKRGILPKQATDVMRSWLFQHIVHPYPTEDEKRAIANQTNLTLLQVNNWFINARRRILQPMLDATNPDLLPKAKKAKPQHRPTQRFWPDSLITSIPQQQDQQLPTGEQTPGDLLDAVSTEAEQVDGLQNNHSVTTSTVAEQSNVLSQMLIGHGSSSPSLQDMASNGEETLLERESGSDGLPSGGLSSLDVDNATAPELSN
ncbi:PKNOX2 [Branchiostoma lanceolatum]|uniref:PKNOX2 protein n=1 Tax=Branchiostoma lanceolatum TaxID=7740 RepID=A0A8J9ZVS1_BRALA|nr:PKNOX2 [Branchiostoma lanceolatum]